MFSLNSITGMSPGCKVSRALTSFALLCAVSVGAIAAPHLSGVPSATVTAAHYYAFQPGAVDSGKKLTFSISNKPSWAQFDSSTGRLCGTPLPQNNVGKYSDIVISASDGASRASLVPFSVTVLPLPNNPPTIKGTPAGTVASGKTYSFQPTATDPDGLTIEFGITNKPSWATFVSATGRLYGTPTATNAATYSNITIFAYDGYHKASLAAFAIVVQGTPASSAGTTTATGTTVSTGTGTTTSTAATTAGSDNFPRLGLLSTGGPQTYANSFQAYAAKFHMVVIGGDFEGWEKDAGYSKETVISSIKGQSRVSTRVFQYVDLNELYNSTNADGNWLPTWYKQVNAMNWWVHPTSTTGAPITDPQSSQKWLVDLGADAPVDPATGLGPYAWAAKYVNDLFHLGRYAGTSSAASLDGFFLDNVLIDPADGMGNTANGDWMRDGTTQAHNAASTYSAVMKGERSFYTYLQTAWPDSQQLGNGGTSFGLAVPGSYSGTDATLNSQILACTSPLSGVMQGGDFEHAIGKTYSIEYYGGSLDLQKWYQTAMNNFGGSKLMLFSQGNVQANGSDPLTFNSSQQPATYSPAWQGARYGITAALMNNGYYFADYGSYDAETVDNRRWFDEYDNAGAGVGYLGQPVAGSAGNPQTTAWSNGVWMREFKNGVVLWNPKGNGVQTVNVSGLLSTAGRAGLKHIAGTQDPAVNNGQVVTSVALKDRDGVILLWTSP
jgi:hypothetical protein